MKKIIFAVFLFLSLMSGFAVTSQTWAERDVVITPAPARPQTARAVEVQAVSTTPAPVVKKPVTISAPQAAAVAQPESKSVRVKPAIPPPPVKKEDPPARKSFFQGLIDKWFSKS